MLQLCTLASGSSGNSLFLKVGEVRLLIDAGVSYRRIARGLAEIGEDPRALDAVFLTHEHGDHVAGLVTLRRKHPELPVWATAGTWRNVPEEARLEGACVLEGGVSYGDVALRPFGISHDAARPVGLRVEWPGGAFGLATDLGQATPVVLEALAGCRALLVEANYDPDRLATGAYPLHLKRRVASRWGHLSNAQAAELLAAVAGPELEHVVLGHLSEENNDAGLALETALEGLSAWAGVDVRVAERQRPSAPIFLQDLRRDRWVRDRVVHPGRRPVRRRRANADQLCLPLS